VRRSLSALAPACGQPLERLGQCHLCSAKRAAQVLLDERRKREQDTVSSIDRTHLKPGEYWNIIDRKWLMDWLEFVNEGGPVRRPLLPAPLPPPPLFPQPPSSSIPSFSLLRFRVLSATPVSQAFAHNYTARFAAVTHLSDLVENTRRG
jgi:hypothetical protein